MEAATFAPLNFGTWVLAQDTMVCILYIIMPLLLNFIGWCVLNSVAWWFCAHPRRCSCLFKPHWTTKNTGKLYSTNLKDVIMKVLLHSFLSLHEGHAPFPPLRSSEVTRLKTLTILSLKIFVSMATPHTQRSKWIWLSEWYLTVLLVFQKNTQL